MELAIAVAGLSTLRRNASLRTLLALAAAGCLSGSLTWADTGRSAAQAQAQGSFAINLASTRDPADTSSLPALDLAAERSTYETSVEIDGETWYRLRLGLFVTEADASNALAELRDQYPRAWITRVSEKERELFLEHYAAHDIDTPGVAEPAAAEMAGDDEELGWQIDDSLPEHPTSARNAATGSRLPLDKLVRRQDDRSVEHPFQIALFDRPLSANGRYEVSPEHRFNYDLDDDDERDLTRVYQDARLEVLYEIGPSTAIFLETQALYRRDRRGDGREDSEFDLKRGQGWIYHAFRPDSGLALQIGRQNISEKRSWWWDADVDAVRLYFSKKAVSAELGIAEEVFPVSIDDIDDDLPADVDDVTRLFGRWSWTWASRQRLELFWLSERDRSGSLPEDVPLAEERVDERDADLDWLGLRSRGRWKTKRIGTFFYWTDIASVRGTEHLTQFVDTDNGFVEPEDLRQLDVRGWAFDAGLTLRPRANRNLSFTAGYAVGSGNDQADTSRDQSFRQSGLNTNKSKLRGVVRFRYYGELLRPELSNLRISTFAIGRRFLSASSVDLVYHKYRQVHADSQLRAARIEAALNGMARDVGEEIDLVVGVEEWRHWELKLIGSVFIAGDAYGAAADEKAYRADLQLKYTF